MRLKPFAHQLVGVERLVRSPYFLLADEPGAGKTKQVIDAAQWLYSENKIDTVIVIAPASVREVWYHEQLGQIREHGWSTVAQQVVWYHSKFKVWKTAPLPDTTRPLQWLITNYDFVRNGAVERREGRRKVLDFPVVNELLESYGSTRTLLVLDESAAVKNHTALQTKAVRQLRQGCGYVWMLNGTPVADTPMDMYAQGWILHPSILDCPDFYSFRARYAVVKTDEGFPQIIKYVNLEDLQKRFAPYILQRLKKDCMDLPEKMPPVRVPVALGTKTWNAYREMRETLCVWLSSNTVATAPHAATKVLRLSQIASGILGGIEEAVPSDEMDAFDSEEVPDYLQDLFGPLDAMPTASTPKVQPVEFIGDEKLAAVTDLLRDLLVSEPHVKLLVWSRYRPEVERLIERVTTKFPKVETGKIYGGQDTDERRHALALLDPRTAPPGAVVVAGTTQTGRTGLNLTAAHHVVYMSHDFSLYTRQQSEDRTHRPGQVHAVKYYNLVATGPKGQKTIDALTLGVLADKANIAEWTTSAWVSRLREE